LQWRIAELEWLARQIRECGTIDVRWPRRPESIEERKAALVAA
jgi:hypothetical protein